MTGPPEPFRYEKIEVGDTIVNTAVAGQGEPLLLLHGYPQAYLMMSPMAIRSAVCRPATSPWLASSEPNMATPSTLPVCRNAVSVPDAIPERDGSTLPSRADVSGTAISPIPNPVTVSAATRAATCAPSRPASTVPMGGPGNPTAVVDRLGAVRGLRGLRVVDASIFPDVPSTPTNITVIMAVEHIARLAYQRCQGVIHKAGRARSAFRGDLG
jgi:choline dehydrogenase-like flavoprotein